VPDDKDLTIEALADSEAELREKLRAYREITLAAFAKLAEQDRTIARQRESIASLREVLRAQRTAG